MTAEIYTLEVHHETDVFASRQAARDVATTVGVEGQDVIRVATALSEVTRDLLAAGGGRVSFTSVAPDVLRVTLTGGAPGPGTSWGSASGVDAARRLMDTVALGLDEEGRTVVVLEKRARSARPVDDQARRELRQRLSDTVGRTSVDELRLQNRDLIAVLEEVQSRKEELERVNAELEETNRGVLALYGELSDELERTNQGVVALYAEIDDKSRLLAEASESKTRFLNNISHELRTPGNSVLGLSRLLLDPAAEPADRRAAPPGRAHLDQRRGPAPSGQRAARPGQGRVRPPRGGRRRRRPRRALRRAARHHRPAGDTSRGHARRRAAAGA